jgi:hypothetical protein
MSWRISLVTAALAVARAQADSPAAPQPEHENWNIYYQATGVGMYHGSFPATYSGVLSLENTPERDVSLTTTLFVGFRWLDTEFYINPEIAGGRGFSHVNGLANSENGELPRVASATPKPYLARGYFTHDFGFGNAREMVESDANQLGGSRPMVRYSISIGRFTITDFFDDNRYTHDPRTQFLGWANMYNGAWDYPADVRGYTWGWVHEFHTRNWSLRYGSGAEPRVANGSQLDRKIFVNHGDAYEVEHRHEWRGHLGAVRVLGYTNFARAGTYAEALKLSAADGSTPDVTATRRDGTLKYGFGVSWDQEVSKDWGIFGRLGWNDGKTESFAFTAVDRLASGGVSVNGRRWHRKDDTVATMLTFSGLSGVHATYLARGGLDFLIGDGALRYGLETSWETYYSARLWKGFWTSFDLMRVANPAYNQDRGPVWIEQLRLHLELGKDDFVKKH